MTDVVDDDPHAVRPPGSKGLHRSSTTRKRAGTGRTSRSARTSPADELPSVDPGAATDAVPGDAPVLAGDAMTEPSSVIDGDDVGTRPEAPAGAPVVATASVAAGVPVAASDAATTATEALAEPTVPNSVVPMTRRAAGRVPLQHIPSLESEHSWLDQEAGPVVRPYTLTGGRSRPFTSGLELLTHVEALYAPDADLRSLQPEHREILSLTRTALSIAEIAGRLDLPVGVVRVLVGDLLQADLVSTFEANAAFRAPDDDVLQAVIDGLRAL